MHSNIEGIKIAIEYILLKSTINRLGYINTDISIYLNAFQKIQISKLCGIFFLSSVFNLINKYKKANDQTILITNPNCYQFTFK